MNWYKHHLGDYDSHTAHLTWDEDMAYTRLLRAYYRHDGPIPESEIYRLTRSPGNNQRAAVDRVLLEFFKKDENGLWHNKRADEEIQAYKSQAEVNKRIATNRYTNRTRSVNEPTTNRPPSQNLEPDTRKSFAQNCAFPHCKKPGTRTRSTNGAGPWYCTEHADGNASVPKHITQHVSLPEAAPASNPTSKFDD